MLEVSNLTKYFGKEKAIENINFSVADNEYVTLLGHSGSGKSVLLKCIAGLDKPDKGKVKLNDNDITSLQCHKRNVGFVQQKYALFPHLNVFDNIAFGLKYREQSPLKDFSQIKKKVEEILELVGLSDQSQKMTGQISGGQKQRVSLARTLITEPNICLLDEPLGALDANLRERMTIELQNIRKFLGISFVHVTGNEFEALAMGQKMLILSEGKLIQSGSPFNIFSKPNNLEVAKNLNTFNTFSGEEELSFVKKGLVDGDIDYNLVKYCAVRMDKIFISEINKKNDNKDSLKAKFLAKEFMGNKIIYFFKLPNNKICEIENHLSIKKQEDYSLNKTYTLTWKIEDIYKFDSQRNVLDN